MLIGEVTGLNLKYHGNIFIAGLTASGKTTHSYMLAGYFGLTYVSGSQIHLAVNGMSPIQKRTFWVTERAKELLTEGQFEKVDSELCNLENTCTGCVFDSWIMPWRKCSEGLCIYLASTLEARVMKGAISRRELNFTIDEEYKNKIQQKDIAAIDLYKKIYNVDIENDLNIFDIIIDNSKFIESPTFESSLVSIKKTHSVLQSAVGYYLTGGLNYRIEFQNHCKKGYVLQNRLI